MTACTVSAQSSDRELLQQIELFASNLRRVKGRRNLAKDLKHVSISQLWRIIELQVIGLCDQENGAFRDTATVRCIPQSNRMTRI